MSVSKIPVGISSCLLGDPVRYDGGHKRHSYIEQTLGLYFEFHRFCPEMAIGMGVPREPVRLVRETKQQQVCCVGVSNPALDVTLALRDCADSQRDWQAHLCGYIFKKDSPSCGMERVRVYTNGQPSKTGSGIFAQRVMQNFPHLPVEEEGRLGDAGLRENFIRRVYVMHRWHGFVAGGLSVHGLAVFHARHKLIIMSHNQNSVRELGAIVASADTTNLPEAATTYIETLMQVLAKPSNRANHVNVLQHIQGYLKKHLDSDDKAELSETIERYRLGELPLVVPITLLKHHFRKSPDPYISDSWYMNPYPQELCLQNAI